MPFTEVNRLYIEITLKKDFPYEFYMYGDRFISDIEDRYDLRSPNVIMLFVAYLLTKTKSIAEHQSVCTDPSASADESVKAFNIITRKDLLESDLVIEYYKRLSKKPDWYSKAHFIIDIQLAMSSLIGWNKYDKMNFNDIDFDLELNIKPFAVYNDDDYIAKDSDNDQEYD